MKYKAFRIEHGVKDEGEGEGAEVWSIVATTEDERELYVADCYSAEDADLVLSSLELASHLHPKTGEDMAAIGIVADRCEQDAVRLDELGSPEVAESLRSFGRALLDRLSNVDLMAAMPELPAYHQLVVDVPRDATLSDAMARLEAALLPGYAVKEVDVGQDFEKLFGAKPSASSHELT